jgi:hypothetical protein
LIEKTKQINPDGLELQTHQENHRGRAFSEKCGLQAIDCGISPPQIQCPMSSITGGLDHPMASFGRIQP